MDQIAIREGITHLIGVFPHRTDELKAIGVIWEVTTNEAFEANGRLPSKIPVLIGPTSTGKTVTAYALGKEFDALVKIILLQQENPDEVAGYLVPANMVSGATNGYHLKYAKPEWFQELEESSAPVKIVFLDELDKAPRELIAPVLTFMRDKILRRWKAPYSTFLIGAMNQADQPLSEAFIARCIFIPWLQKQDEDKEQFPSLGELIQSFAYDATVEFPPLPEKLDKAALHFLATARQHPWFWEQDVRELLIRGMLAPAAAEMALRFFSHIMRPPVDVLIQSPELTTKVIHVMNEEDVFLLYKEMHPMFCHRDPTETLVFGEFQQWIWEDDTGERAWRYQQFMQQVPLEHHAMFALHPETWNTIVKPKLNGDGTLESFQQSAIYRAQMKRWEIEGSGVVDSDVTGKVRERISS